MCTHRNKVKTGKVKDQSIREHMPFPMGQQGWQAKSRGGEPVRLLSTSFLSEASWELLIQVVLQTKKKKKDPSIIVVGTFAASNGNSKIRF